LIFFNADTLNFYILDALHPAEDSRLLSLGGSRRRVVAAKVRGLRGFGDL
jgi:hypothetical protein